MDVRNCIRCGKVFSGFGKTICSSCEKKEEQDFKTVKEYVDENTRCTIAEVAEATEVPAKKILRFIKEGRLVISQGMAAEIACEQCGKPISTGRYCDGCVIRLNNKVNEVFDKVKTDKTSQERVGVRMHTRAGKKL